MKRDQIWSHFWNPLSLPFFPHKLTSNPSPLMFQKGTSHPKTQVAPKNSTPQTTCLASPQVIFHFLIWGKPGKMQATIRITDTSDRAKAAANGQPPQTGITSLIDLTRESKDGAKSAALQKAASSLSSATASPKPGTELISADMSLALQ